VELHDQAIKRMGGRPGILHVTCVEETLAAGWQAELYSGAPTPGLVFAAYLLFYFPTNHCFDDGNKRAAWLAATVTLAQLGLDLDVSVDDAYAFVISIALGHTGPVRSGAEVLQWIETRLVALQP
jgi:death-on-curing protein